MRQRPSASSGFSLLELAVIVLIIAILAAVTLVAVSKLRQRAQRAQCTNNLRQLAAATNLFIQQHGSWPQIPPAGGELSQEQFSEAWINALAPFGPTRQTWICPAMQNRLGNPDYSSAETARVDYIATTFDDKPTSPHEWPRQPWFIEAGDVHGTGSLILFTDGSISDLETVVKEISGQ